MGKFCVMQNNLEVCESYLRKQSENSNLNTAEDSLKAFLTRLKDHEFDSILSVSNSIITEPYAFLFSCCVLIIY